MSRSMKTSALAGLAGLMIAALAASTLHAAPEKDLEREAAMAQRFAPFDSGGGPDWENAFPTPFMRAIPAGKPEPVPFSLKPGAYMIVVLCNCQSMKVTLVDTQGNTFAPLRSNEQAAMYSLDVSKAGDYLTGIDMGGCDEKACDVGIKVYRKKT
jgi:hypothetical protein